MLKSVCLVLLCLCFNVYAQSATKNVVITYPMLAENAKTLALTGSFSTIKDSALSPRADGLINELLVDIGDKVQKDDKLMQLDTTLIRLSIAEQKSLIEQATIQQQEAQRLVSEAERLLKQRHISQTELAKRKANLALSKAEMRAVKAALASMQETLKRHTVYAPFDGIISNKHVEIGEWISRGDPTVNLTSLDTLYLDIKVPQEHFSKIDLNTTVIIKPDTNPEQKLDAVISKIIPISDSQSRSLLVRVEVDATTNKLVAGTSASVQIQLQNETEQGVILPRDALLIHPDGGHSVFVIDAENMAQRRIVKVAGDRENGILITTGMHINDKVVIRGNEVLNQGDHVTIQDM